MKDQKQQTEAESASALNVAGAGQAVRDLRQQMTFLKALTPKERGTMPKVSPSALTLMETALQAARENPSLIPPSIDLTRYGEEVQSCRGLYSLLTQLQELCSDVQDTLAVLGKEANNA